MCAVCMRHVCIHPSSLMRCSDRNLQFAEYTTSLPDSPSQHLAVSITGVSQQLDLAADESLAQ